MSRPLFSLFVGMVFVCQGCAVEDDTGDVVESISFPHSVTIDAERGLVIMTGEVMDHADFINCDLVTYANETIKIQSGCPEKQTECRPLHLCKPTGSSMPAEFDTVQSVCTNIPSEDDPPTIPNAKAGMGFTVKLNTTEGYARVLVREVTGTGQAATVTLDYMPFGQ